MTQKKTADSDTTVENASMDNGDDQSNGDPVNDAGQSADAAALLAELEHARQQAAENQDKFLRSKAETENIRRRAATDVANAHKFAIERFALEMLAVKDSLERARAIQLQDDTSLVEKMFEGLDLTLKLMDSIFLKFALATIEPQKGDKFSPEKHQAMSILESDEIPANHVLTTVQKGYTLNDRLLRPAMVIVSKDTQPRENT